MMNKRPYNANKKAGFTLIEVLMTMVIMAIAAGIAIPAFARWLPSYHLKSAARDVFSNMQMAKLEAIKRNSTCAVTLNESSGSYEITQLGRTVSLDDYGNGVKFGGPDTDDVTGGSFTFNARGMINETTPQYVYVTNENNTAYYRIAVTGVGNINITKLNGSGWE